MWNTNNLHSVMSVLLGSSTVPNVQLWVERRELHRIMNPYKKCVATKGVCLCGTFVITSKTQFLIYKVMLPGHSALEASWL